MKTIRTQEGKKTQHTRRDRSDQIPVPVPSIGLDPSVVEAAREAVRDNRKPPLSENRFWKLAKSVLYCGGRGRRSVQKTSWYRKSGEKAERFYYRCPLGSRYRDECPMGRNLRAEETEERVWSFVWSLLTNVEEMEAAVDRRVEEERRRLRKPEREAEMLAGRLVDLDRQRSRLQNAYMQGAFEVDELKSRLADLEEGREATEEALAAARNRSGRIAKLLSVFQSEPRQVRLVHDGRAKRLHAREEAQRVPPLEAPCRNSTGRRTCGYVGVRRRDGSTEDGHHRDSPPGR